MALPPTGTPQADPRALGEESDVVVALIRTAFIIAFIFTRGLWGSSVPMPHYMDVVLGAAAGFNLGLFQAHLRGRHFHALRPVALLLDLLLVTAAIAGFGRSGEFLQTSRDLFGLYYLVVITAAIWFKRSGALISALVAIGLAAVTPWLVSGEPPGRDLLVGSAKAPLLLLVAFVAGYLVRARDAEHQAAVELGQEMRLARALQSRMLPATIPEVPGYELGLRFEPARLVGGDFYGLQWLDQDRLLIVLADMAGKSVYGLVHLSLVHSHLQAAAGSGLGPAAIAEATNHGAYAALQPESYAALFVGVLRPREHTLTFVNCGHVPPWRLAGDAPRPPEQLQTGGIVMGAVPEPRYVERTIKLQPGEMVVGYSDGVSEARDGRREEFGEERVAGVAGGHAADSAQQVADAVVEAAHAFAHEGGGDDVTVLVLKRTADRPAEPQS